MFSKHHEFFYYWGMKRLDTFLEGLLSKSNKTKIMGTKELILSLIEDRIKDRKSNFMDRITGIMDTLRTTYNRFSAARIRPAAKPRCFITAYPSKDGNIFALHFTWIQSEGERTYWNIGWWLGVKEQHSMGLEVDIKRGVSMSILLETPVACYEIQEEDMKDYLRTIDNLEPLKSYYDEKYQAKIKQITT